MMTETELEPKPKPPRRRRRRFGIWLLLSLVLMAAMFALAVLSLTERSLSVPGWVTAQIETRLNTVLAPVELKLGGVEVVFSRNGVPHVHLSDVTVFDANGRPLARMPDLRITLAARPLLSRRLVVQRVALTGAEITLRRGSDGQFDLALGAAPASFRAASIGEVMDQVDQVFSTPALAAVEGVSVEGLHLTYEDARAGRTWQVDGGLLTLDQTPTDIAAQLFFSLTSDQGVPSEVAMSFDTVKGSPEARMSANFSDVPAADIATQSPALAILTVLDAPISGALRTGVNSDGSLDLLNAALEIGAGALQPVEEATPIRFDSGKAYFSYDPVAAKITMEEVSVKTAALSLTGDGQAFLRDEVDGWPTSLVTQIRLHEVTLMPEGVFAAPARFNSGAVDMKLTLDPFTVTIGQAVLSDESGVDYRGKGTVRARPEGWKLALDLAIDQIGGDRLLELWPLSLAPKIRQWVGENVLGGEVVAAQAALRLVPDKAPVISLSYEFRNATVRYLKTMPPVEKAHGYSTINDNAFTLVLESGTITAPSGGTIDAAGTVVRVVDMSARPSQGDITLKTDSSLEAALSLLDLPPLELMSKAGKPVDLAEGRAQMETLLRMPFGVKLQPGDVDYTVSGTLSDVRSDKIVEGRILAARELSVSADRSVLTVSGDATLDGVPIRGLWSQPHGPGNDGKSRIEGTVELSRRAVETFNIGLPKGSVSGSGLGHITLDLARGEATRFHLTSDLSRVGLRIDAIGWSKPKNAKGLFEAEGSLGVPPVVDALKVAVSGLRADGGRITVNSDGTLNKARFARVRVGRWLDAPVVLSGRGATRAPSVTLPGGTIDLGNSPFTRGDVSSSDSGPVTLALDTLKVSSGITLQNLRGTLKSRGGLNGSLKATVKGGAPVTITLAPARRGTGIRVQSANAGGVLRGAGIFEKSKGGSMDMILTPRGPPGDYDGTLSIKNTRVKGAPALAELLSAISVVGILEMLDGQGLMFGDVAGKFRLTPHALQVTSGSAVGPSLGISMAGLVNFDTSQMKMQGVISPIYMINGIGALVSRRGEGLFGFNYSLSGSTSDPQVGVNPLSILTPGIFREIFRKRPPEIGN